MNIHLITALTRLWWHLSDAILYIYRTKQYLLSSQMNSFFHKCLVASPHAVAAFQRFRIGSCLTWQNRVTSQTKALNSLSTSTHIQILRDIANRWSPINPVLPARRPVLAKYREANQQMFRFSELVRAPTEGTFDRMSRYAGNLNSKAEYIVPVTPTDLKKSQLLHALSKEIRHPLLILTSNIYGSLFFLLLKSPDPAHLKLLQRAQRWSKVKQQNIKVGQRLLIAIQKAIEDSAARFDFPKT